MQDRYSGTDGSTPIRDRPEEVFGHDKPAGEVLTSFGRARTTSETATEFQEHLDMGPEQERAFSNVKEEITKPTVLTHYNPEASTKISADASSFGLGAVLLQRATASGDLSHTLLDPSRKPKGDMHRSERKHLQLHGPVKSSTTMSWKAV